MCRSSPGKCLRQGLVYTITCQVCKVNRGLSVVYTGETSRTGFDRGAEWLDGLRRKDPSNPLVEHINDHHPQSIDYKMEAKVFTTSPLLRQTSEAFHIAKQSQEGIALNRKGEWGQNLAPRILVEGRTFMAENDNVTHNDNDTFFYSNRLDGGEEPGGHLTERGGLPGEGGPAGAIGGDHHGDGTLAPPLSLGVLKAAQVGDPAPPSNPLEALRGKKRKASPTRSKEEKVVKKKRGGDDPPPHPAIHPQTTLRPPPDPPQRVPRGPKKRAPPVKSQKGQMSVKEMLEEMEKKKRTKKAPPPVP